jgi:hypothetical protein
MSPLSLTKQHLQNMKEADLRIQVLIPLFKVMGFKDVSHYHGGTGEQGKDITMWQANVLGDREYYAIVVKAGRITGEAKGKGSAAEVQMQIAQAFGSKFTDTADLSERQATRCWVVSSHEIKKEATESIKNALGPRATDGSVRFIDGDELWELIQRHQPERTIAQTLWSANQVLDHLSDHHRVVTQLRGGAIHLALEPKYPGAGAVESTEIRASFTFPADEAVKPIVQAVDSHIKRGTPVTIPGAFLTRFDVPKPLEPFLKEGPIESIAIGPIEGEKEISTTLVARDVDGAEYRLTGVRFRAVRLGSEEFELTSSTADAPWVFSITANKVTRRFTMTFTIPDGPRSVKRAMEGVRFQNVLSRSGRLRFLNDETGLELFSCDVPIGVFSPAPAGWLQFLESLMFLQERCRVAVNLPDEVSFEDAREVIELAARIRAGISDEVFDHAMLTMKPNAPTDLFRTEAQDGFRLGIVREEFFELFGTMFPLGIVAHIGTRLRLTEKSRSALQTSRLDEELALEIEGIDENSRRYVAYLKWLDDIQIQDLRGRVPGMSFELPDAEN